jgi:hypothetical protein
VLRSNFVGHLLNSHIAYKIYKTIKILFLFQNLVAEVEHQLAEFFKLTPKEILRMKKLSRYETMIKTAICQYHGLESESKLETKK